LGLQNKDSKWVYGVSEEQKADPLFLPVDHFPITKRRLK
jgi:hypothetical protein